MKRLNERGSVLAHVLITAMVSAMIATGLVRMMLVRHAVIVRATEGAQKKKDAEAALNRLLTTWAANNDYCSSPSGVTCSGVTTTCSACTCTIAGGNGVSVSGSGTYPNCTLSIVSTE